ncbi:MAG: transglutaminase domain-containing protein [Candidatus Latescibacteria bacterium]|nr:transglutaminase domain-containing protein [Candidatus Latescibacterota bacterium]
MLFFVALLLFLGSVMMIRFTYTRTYADPRWRKFDYHSRQASEGEIYNVAERPIIRTTVLTAHRTLRFEFLPEIPTDSWQIISLTDGKVTHSQHPEICFPDHELTESYRFVPNDSDLVVPMEITVQFYPREKYAEANLSWPDNYYSPKSTYKFSSSMPHSIRDWAGLPSHDLDMIHARSILEDRIDLTAQPSQRLNAVFVAVMADLQGTGGLPNDELLDASPMRTYEELTSGRSHGFCENSALVFYLFANAAGIPTRLVDMAGMFGPLKLTGHYVCECWMQDQGCWAYVDPQSGVSCVYSGDGRMLHTLDIKRLVDMGLLSTCRVKQYDPDAGEIRERDASEFSLRINGYLRGDLVLAYKFGYPRNLSYRRLRNFLRHPVLLYATFQVPPLYLGKLALFVLASLSGLTVMLCGLWQASGVPF